MEPTVHSLIRHLDGEFAGNLDLRLEAGAGLEPSDLVNTVFLRVEGLGDLEAIASGTEDGRISLIFHDRRLRSGDLPPVAVWNWGDGRKLNASRIGPIPEILTIPPNPAKLRPCPGGKGDVAVFHSHRYRAAAIPAACYAWMTWGTALIGFHMAMPLRLILLAVLLPPFLWLVAFTSRTRLDRKAGCFTLVRSLFLFPFGRIEGGLSEIDALELRISRMRGGGHNRLLLHRKGRAFEISRNARELGDSERIAKEFAIPFRKTSGKYILAGDKWIPAGILKA